MKNIILILSLMFLVGCNQHVNRTEMLKGIQVCENHLGVLKFSSAGVVVYCVDGFRKNIEKYTLKHENTNSK